MRTGVGVAAAFVVFLAVAGVAYVDGTARAQVTPGQESADECPAGQVRRHGECVDRPRPCPSGQHRVRGECVADEPQDAGAATDAGATGRDAVAPASRDAGAATDAGATARDAVSAASPDAGRATGAATSAGELQSCDGGKYDPASALCWQDPPPESTYTWQQAMDYCAALSLAGHGAGEWHLPTIGELRSLIRGCPGTETGGSCGVTDSCLGGSCWSDACTGCARLAGPGEGGAYWPAGFGGRVGWYWSSSSYAGSASNAWGVTFNTGHVYHYDKTPTRYVRCVRRGP
jgi:hypothetical protein